jgi:hypothetical protein
VDPTGSNPYAAFSFSRVILLAYARKAYLSQVYIFKWGSPLRSSQNSWLQIQGSWFDSRRYQIFW